jgi:hypothetical protein
MKFDRYVKNDARPVSGQRRAAAKRTLDRLRDEVSLFPDLQPTETPDERIKRLDAEFAVRLQAWRDVRAANWRRARRAVKALVEPQRAQFEERYTANRFMPGDPVYVLEILHSIKSGRGW